MYYDNTLKIIYDNTNILLLQKFKINFSFSEIYWWNNI